MKLTHRPRLRCPGFTFLEALMLVGVIAIIVGIAVTSYGGVQHTQIKRVRDQRNAQEITSLVMGATAAGAEVIVPGNMQQSIETLIQGRTGTVGTFKGRLFRLPSLTNEQITGAMQYLEWNDGMISYASH